MSKRRRRRNKVQERAGGRCEYCHTPEAFSSTPFALEHIVPRSKGGRDTAANLAFSCQGCNNHKYTKTQAVDPATEKTVPLYNPRRDTWQEHFVWNETYDTMLGKTESGRATINALKLNREPLRKSRRILFAAGEHP